jgi:dipeptidyl aminopeptidase/acylaminoacyl peptidase
MNAPKRQKLLGVVCALLALGGGARAAAEAPPSPVPIEAVLAAPTLAAYSPPQFSPDGRLLAYVVTDNARRRKAVDDQELLRTGVAWYGIASDIWVTDLETGERRNVSSGGNNWAPAWSPDGRSLAFLGDRSSGPDLGPARLWVWERASGALRAASDADVREGFAGIEWAADGSSVLVSLFPQDLGREGYVAAMRGKAPPKSAPSPGGVTATVFEFDPSIPGAAPSTDQINLDIWRRDLALVDARTGAVRRVVAGSRVGHYVLSPDRRKLAYTVLARAEKPGTGQYLYDVMVEDLASGETRAVAPEVRLTLLAASFGWSPNGEWIVYRTGGPSADDDVYVVPAAGGEARRVAHNPPSANAISPELDPPVWDPSGRNVYFLRDRALWRAAADGSGASAFAPPAGRDLEIVAPRQGRLFSPDGGRSAVVMTLDRGTKRAGFARLDLATGAVTQILEEDKRYGGYGTEPTVSPDGTRLAYIAEDALHPPDVFVAGGAEMRARRASEVAPALSDHGFGRAEVVEWRTVDGAVAHGALVYPAGYEVGKTYPLIVKVYGGSEISNDLNRFGYAVAPFENLQIFATRGYAILVADSKVNVGTPMVDLMKSVMPGINKVVDMGVADPDRVGVTGHSYGGYSALSLVVQSPRFKAAVVRAGMGDLVAGYGGLAPDGTNYGVAWSEGGQGRMGGTPWDYRERYIENSPVFYLDRVETPVLIIHGSEDDAVPAALADEIFTGLRRLGKTVTYARYAGEGHWEGTWGHANQVDALERAIAWFDRYLKAEPKQAAARAPTPSLTRATAARP